MRKHKLGLFREREDEPAPKSLTFGDVIPQFIGKHAKRHTKDWKGTKSVLLRMYKLHGLKIDAIKRADVIRELERLISETSRIMVGEAHGQTVDWLQSRNCIHGRPSHSRNIACGRSETAYQGSSPRTVVFDTEIKSFLKGCGAEGHPFEEFGKLLLLTGQLLREIADMRWSELDLDKGTLTLKAERTEDATLHVVPLPRQAIDIVKTIPRFQGSDYVFTTTGASPISGFGRFKKRLETFVGL